MEVKKDERRSRVWQECVLYPGVLMPSSASHHLTAAATWAGHSVSQSLSLLMCKMGIFLEGSSWVEMVAHG